MKRTDDLNVELCGFFEDVLHLSAVLADDSDVIASRLASPVLLNVKSAEFSEAVRGEEHLVLAVIGHDDLGPVNHRRGYKVESVLAQNKGVAFLDDDPSVLKLRAEEVLHHRKSLGAGNDGRLGIVCHKVVDVCGVIRLHMLHNKVVGLALTQSLVKIAEPLEFEVAVNRVHNRSLLIKNHV